ncbi:MAG: tryptophan synthase subunit alpha [Planctomycetota bacterium]
MSDNEPGAPVGAGSADDDGTGASIETASEAGVSSNRIERIFAQKRADEHRALMPFLCGGYPTLASTPALISACSDAGGSIIEIGVPFSDPIADGPVIAAAMHEALTAGVTMEALFDRVAEARSTTEAGLVAMVSVSLVQGSGGPVAFAKLAAEAGFDGLIVPDAPVEESDRIRDAAATHGLTLSLLVAPTTPPKRVEAIAQACTGFVYLLARSGVTGERSDAPDVSAAVSVLRSATELPIACGFGISTASQVRSVVEHADAAIVGSALVRRLGEPDAGDPADVGGAFVSELAAGLNAEPSL